MECLRADLGCALEQSVDECGHVTVQPSRLLQIATGSQCVDHSVPEMNTVHTSFDPGTVCSRTPSRSAVGHQSTLILSLKQLDLLYKSKLFLGQNKPQQPPLWIAIGCQSTS